MTFNKQNFVIKTIYSPFISVDIFINVNLLYFCITQGMSKLIIQIFINTEIFGHVSMVNGNSKLKYSLLVQEEKKNSKWNKWFNLIKYERLLDAAGESCGVTCLSVGVPAFSVIINTSAEMKFCRVSYSCITTEMLKTLKSDYLWGKDSAYSTAKWHLVSTATISTTTHLVWVKQVSNIP